MIHSGEDGGGLYSAFLLSRDDLMARSLLQCVPRAIPGHIEQVSPSILSWNLAATERSSGSPSIPMMYYPDLIIKILPNHYPKFRMFQIPRLQDLVNRSLFGPAVDTLPSYTLMRTGEIASRDWLCRVPTHRNGRCICVTHDALTQHIKAVFVVIAVISHLPIREMRKVVIGIHVAMEAFLRGQSNTLPLLL